MVVCYVRLYASLAPSATPSSRVYALLLPSADKSRWQELEVRRSPLGGYGLFPKKSPHLDWPSLGLSF